MFQRQISNYDIFFSYLNYEHFSHFEIKSFTFVKLCFKWELIIPKLHLLNSYAKFKVNTLNRSSDKNGLKKKQQTSLYRRKTKQGRTIRIMHPTIS